MSKDPVLESISPKFGSSLKIHNYLGAANDHAPTWHFHPEMEIAFINGGSGKRHIGNHVSYYNNGDLIFIGANLPHFGFTDSLTGNKSEVVIQAKEDFLGSQFLDIPEMQQIKQLLYRSKQGIVFHEGVRNKIGPQIEALLELPSFEQLLAFLNILKQLAETEDYTLLNVEKVILESKPQDTKRMDIIFSFVSQEFTRSISLSEIADKVSMTEQAFSRYFKKKTGKTFTQFVNEYRLVHASKLLSEQHLSITDICYASGFNNFSHFNKSFKTFTGKSPSKFRDQFKNVVE
ncbi:MAG: AraC family transcriptional regulator [Bacteroidia bacterium]|nr:AraC family transcriptional regulator [Bacteroidia bacterium]NNF31337.1 AraC family transcriptional regulator [Flavobacteriaceae bacterium]MBT8276587.1 AraC family transcriptional regulator [Bacteroidia bacterium]NNJ82548.1 AraC family transcriptional regulator [Flavobacteriaceae bacterium]NNK54389.1 AraC family transcriptional regulator [Flavobacteriaceae bacterium]